jgi:hypothetical protein
MSAYTKELANRLRIGGVFIWVEAADELDRLRADLAQRTAERDALAAENAALKAKSDPLAEMWRELAEYQPQAERDGHGESWRRMCAQRTEDAAESAQDNAWVASISSGLTEPWVAAMCARWAVAWRHHSEQNTQRSIGAIRRAKEAQR